MYEPAALEEQQRARRADDSESARAARTAPAGPTGALARLQRAAGNGATSKLIQTKLKVGAANDPLEAEADRVADHLVEALQRSSDDDGSVPVTSADGAVARDTDDGAQAVVGLEGGAAPDSAVEAISKAGAGQPLPQEIARKAGGVLGADLSDVRVHTGEPSQQAAQELGATAFTKGSDIHFGAGQYDPNSPSGQKLLAHEVAHTVQQGGRAQRQVIRRMPSPVAVKTRTGKKEKAGTKIFGKTRGATTTYTALMDGLRAHSDYIIKTEIAKDRKQAQNQVQTIHRYIEFVVAAARAYVEKGDGDAAVVEVCSELVANERLEKLMVVDVMGHWQRNPHGISNLPNPKWYQQLADNPRNYTFRAKDAGPKAFTASGGSDKGQNKEIKFGTNEAGVEGVFANDDVGGTYEDPEFDSPRTMLGWYGAKGDLKLGNRSIAMSRLDKLLNGGVIARTERAVAEDKVGTFQELAKGSKMVDAMMANEDLKDPNLARLLSRLQLIDAIAGQVDRHAGNYYVQRDKKTKKIIGVTGIDLDMAWMADDPKAKRHVKDQKTGKWGAGKSDAMTFDMEVQSDKYPGFSKWVDKEMAEVILALKDEDLRAILVDLLDEKEVEAAIARLHHLQKLLKDSSTVLLKPNEWDTVLDKLGDEKNTTGWKTAKSYFGRDATA